MNLPKSEEELKEGVEKYSSRAKSDMDTTSGDGFAAADATHAGLHLVLLGEIDEALKWFELASNQYRLCAQRGSESVTSSNELKNIPALLGSAVRMSVLSGNGQLQREIAREALNLDRSYPYVVEHTGEEVTIEIDEDRFHHLKAWAGLVVQEESETRSHLSTLNTLLREAKDPGDRQQRFTAEACVIEGIISENVSLAAEGLREVLTHHQEQIRGSKPELDDEAICVEATALIILSHCRGLSLSTDSEFVPTTLVEYLTQ